MENMNEELIVKNLGVDYCKKIYESIPVIGEIIFRIISGEKVRIAVIHHNDLDGYGVKLVWKFMEKLYPNLEVEYVCEFLRATNETILRIINDDKTDYIVIGDLHLEDSAIDNELIMQCSSKFVLLDHHTSALKFNDYKFAFVHPHVEKEGIITSGALLMFYGFIELLESQKTITEMVVYKRFIEYIAAYDTYFFKKVPEVSKLYFGDIPNTMNMLFKNAINKDEFMDDMCNNILRIIDGSDTVWANVIMENSKEYVFSDSQLKLLDFIEYLINDDIKKAQFQMNTQYIGKYKVAVYYYNGKYTSEIGNKICDANPDIDYMIIINMNRKSCSLRTVKDINLVEELLIEIPGAGGHPQACGFSFTDDANVMNILRKYLVNKNTVICPDEEGIKVVDDNE